MTLAWDGPRSGGTKGISLSHDHGGEGNTSDSLWVGVLYPQGTMVEWRAIKGRGSLRVGHGRTSCCAWSRSFGKIK